MCTVSFIPVNDRYFITSNRDEKNSRERAVAPMEHGDLIFPKDAKAGGTWIAVHKNGNGIVLLNGAFENHISFPPYKRSRGLVLLDIISSSRPVSYFNKMDLYHIEPFTTVIIDKGNLFECRWDGTYKHCVQLRKNRPYLWSSATLYSKESKREKEQVLQSFLNRNPIVSQEDIISLHQLAFQITGKPMYSTVSVTSISLSEESTDMKYFDLLITTA